ncbi:MAG: excinuclease ABC subunit UvrA, partial [Hyphomicrobiaceae bacterium]
MAKTPSSNKRSDSNKVINVRGAREHNLRGVHLTIPRDALIVFTGLSGSGKSSLAFDTIYAEGQRRYVESLSAYARQFLEMMQKPDVDHIDGLSPAISIEQKTTSRNPRSTVGTVTEIYDYLRLLFARVGVPYSPATGLPIESQTVTQMVDRILELDEGTRLYLLAPIVKGRKGEFRKDLAELMKKGFQRVKINGQFYEIPDAPKLDKKYKHDIDVVVDRIVVRADIATRLADSVETALDLADGIAIAEFADRELPKKATKGANKSKNDTHERVVFSARFACPVSGFTIDEVEPRLFSFNSPAGACPSCDGLGTELQFEPELVVPDDNLSLRQGAIQPWAKTGATSPYYEQTLQALARHLKIQMTTPWAELSRSAQNAILFGTDGEDVAFTYEDGLRKFKTKKPFEGVINNIERRWRETDSQWVRDELSRYQGNHPCEDCSGFRLKPQALCVKVGGQHIGEVCDLSIRKAGAWFEDLPATFSPQQTEIATRILKEIRERLRFLNDVGLDYLTLSRSSGTLSGGESQRIRLASQIGSGLTGVLYVLDEPSIGLHQRDNERLLGTLRHLRDLGNTVIVVEHDEDAVLTADHVVDIGPGAGVHGGQIVAQGSPHDIMNSTESLTGQYLKGTRQIPVPPARREPNTRKQVTVVGASENNLRNVTGSIPLGLFTCVTGVSGSGKSTFLIDTMYKAIARKLTNAREQPGAHKKIDGLQHLDKVIDI